MSNNYQINETTLQNAGYKTYPYPFSETVKSIWQKTIRKPDEEWVKLYFLNFKLHDFYAGGERRTSVSVECHLYRTDGLSHPDETTIQMTLPCSEVTTIEQIEAFFADVYVKLGCVPDIHNN